MFGQIFAGVGLGLLVGVLVGLSFSPVVSVVVGALATGMTALLGFGLPAKNGEPAHAVGSVGRLGSFGIACAAAVLLSLFVRTHNWMSPKIADQVAEVRKAGYSEEEARSWVAYKNFGTLSWLPPDIAEAEQVAKLQKAGYSTEDALRLVASTGAGQEKSPTDGRGAPITASVLFSSSGSDECHTFDTNRYKDTKEHLNALQLLGGKYAEYAKKISALDAGHQKMVLDSLRLLFCPQ